jgi:hypothetical protein
MTKKFAFVILWLMLLLVLSGCGSNRRIRARIPIDTSSGISLEEKTKIRAEEIRLEKEREELEKRKVRTYTVYEKQALEDIKRAHQEIEGRQRALANAKVKAELRCGNPDMAHRVVVDPDAVNYWSWQAYWRVTFHNRLGVDVYIKMVDPNRKLSDGLPGVHSAVEYLGPGCSVTLNRSIRAVAETQNWSPVVYSYEVTSYDNSFYLRTRDYSLYPGNSFRQATPDVVMLQK